VRVIPLLSAEEAAEVLAQVRALPYEEGRRTARGAAREVKHNTQATTEASEELADGLHRRLWASRDIESAAFPKVITTPRFNRYSVGDRYGMHVDTALMGRSGPLRTDLSFTLFLTPPEEYEGGELQVAAEGGMRRAKLAAGSLVLYDTGSLHQVTPVTSGERISAIGWVESWIADPGYRSLMTRLTQIRSGVEAEGVSPMLRTALDETLQGLLRHGAR